MNKATRIVLSSFIGCMLLCGVAAGQEKPRAARSVHLWYRAPEAVAFYNEVIVERSAAGSYFCVCGWDQGYFGIQELGNGKKVVIFSVWDSNQNDKNALAEEKRVKLLHKDEKVRIGRFGGEGSGGQSFLDYDWRIGETYRLMVSAKADGERTEYAIIASATSASAAATRVSCRTDQCSTFQISAFKASSRLPWAC